MKNNGVTLLEMLFTVAILTIVMATLAGLAISIGDTSQIRQSQATTYFEARRAMEEIVRQVRQAANRTLTTLPANTLSFQAATDDDSNGTAVNVSGKLELGGVQIVKRDTDNRNNDEFRSEQLVLIDGENVRVLANGLLPDEDINANNALDTGEDINNNGVLDHGLWFSEWTGGSRRGVQVDIQVVRESRRGISIVAHLTEVVVPRN